MFGFVEKVFFTVLTILSCVNPLSTILLSAALLNTTPLKCISMTNQKCKIRLKIINVNSDELMFYPLVLKQVNAVVVVTISLIHMRKCVFMMM